MRIVSKIGMAFALVAAIPVAADNPAVPTPRECLRGVRDYLARFDKCSFRVRETCQILEMTGYPSGHVYSESTASIIKHGNSIRRTSEQVVHYRNRGKAESRRDRHESICVDGRYLGLNLDADTGRNVEGALADLGHMPREDRFLYCRTMVPFLDRFLPYAGDIIAFLERANCTTKASMEQGHPVVVLEAVGQQGTMSVTLDPSRGMLPLGVALRMGSADKQLDGKVLGEISEDEGGPVHQVLFRLVLDRLELVGGVHVVTAFTLFNESETGRRKAWVRQRTAFELSDLAFDPPITPDTFKPSVAIPNGTRVTVNGQRMINHEWRDGEVVKSINQDSVAGLEGNRFHPGRGWMAWLLIGAALLAALGGGYWGYRRWIVASGGDG